MAVLAFLALLAAAAFWVLLPLARKEDYQAGAVSAAGELKDLCVLRDVAYETLRDLESDFGMGKMGEADYRELKTRTQAETAEILRRIESLDSSRAGRPGVTSPRPGGDSRH
jgi:hypothetical protein